MGDVPRIDAVERDEVRAVLEEALERGRVRGIQGRGGRIVGDGKAAAVELLERMVAGEPAGEVGARHDDAGVEGNEADLIGTDAGGQNRGAVLRPGRLQRRLGDDVVRGGGQVRKADLQAARGMLVVFPLEGPPGVVVHETAAQLVLLPAVQVDGRVVGGGRARGGGRAGVDGLYIGRGAEPVAVGVAIPRSVAGIARAGGAEAGVVEDDGVVDVEPLQALHSVQHVLVGDDRIGAHAPTGEVEGDEVDGVLEHAVEIEQWIQEDA